VILQTERLRLRPVAPSDHDALHAMFTEPGVRRVIFDNQVITPEQTDDIIQLSVELFRSRGFGLWITTVGFGGFWYFRHPPELELLYAVADAHVKHGYGREIARAIIDYGFGQLKMDVIRASTDPTHVDSRRVLDALGFTFERQDVVDGLDTVFYTRARER
jgi:RimJ/RimL family protein N-acetyltransferase